MNFNIFFRFLDEDFHLFHSLVLKLTTTWSNCSKEFLSLCKVMIYTHRTQKSNYSKFFLDCLSLSHHMVAFLWLIIYLNIHKQEWEKFKWASTGICRGFDELLNCVILFSELDGWFCFFKYQNYFLFFENNTWFPFLTAL